ncbi:MAG: TIM barrel protein, partial [Akkermansiaceae bacterium]|nr:TIM barrel protein [Akkermansiaceae bacterium]
MSAKEIPIGCGEWGFRDLPMRQHFEIARQLGFHWLEFGIGGDYKGRLNRRSTDADIEGFLDLLDEFEINCPCCALENDFTLADPAAHDEMVARTLDQFNIAAMCRATHLRLHAGFTPAAEMTDEIWDRMIDAFRLCQAEASPRKLTIAIETISIGMPNDD